MLREACLVGVLALAITAPVAGAESAATVLQKASDAMGAGALQSIRFEGEGVGYAYGQSYKPGMAWPKYTLHSFARSIDYPGGAMRTEFTLSRAERLGGGGYPLVGQQKADQYLRGNAAWNVAGSNVSTGPHLVADRIHQLWISPHGAIKAALAGSPRLGWREQGGKRLPVVSFTAPGRFTGKLFLNAQNLVERVDSRLPDPVLGEVAVVTNYDNYHDYGGVKFPTRIRQSYAGFPVLDLTVKAVQPNAATALEVPDAVRNATVRVTADQVADGVWFLGGGTHNSVLIEMQDHLVLVETPLDDSRSVAVIEQARQVVPGKPIRWVINSHHHHDHAGGLRAAAAEGIGIITQAGNVAYLERGLKAHSRIAPDRLAKAPRPAKVHGVKDQLVLEDATRRVEVRRITGSVHNDSFLMVYLPKEKLLVEADLYTPPPVGAPPPAQPNANTVNLIENLKRQKLAVERVLPLHGRVVPASDLYAAAKMAAAQ